MLSILCEDKNTFKNALKILPVPKKEEGYSDMLSGYTDKKEDKKLTRSEFWEVLKGALYNRCNSKNRAKSD